MIVFGAFAAMIGFANNSPAQSAGYPGSGSIHAGYQPVGDDGIAASPKLRAFSGRAPRQFHAPATPDPNLLAGISKLYGRKAALASYSPAVQAVPSGNDPNLVAGIQRFYGHKSLQNQPEQFYIAPVK